jgi:gliding motility-associated lipoprotein GldH
MTIKKYNLFLLFIIVIVAFSCDSKRVFEENKEIVGSVWNRNNVISFKIPISDTLSPHNVYLNIRQNGQYDKSNLYLFINIISPKGDKIRDTVNCILADTKGKWLGSGLGDLYSNQLMYKHNIGFPHAGYYTFEIEQAMRVDNLKNVEDIGVRIERAR